MVEAGNLKAGTYIKKDDGIFKVLEVETRTGQARFSSHVHIKLQNVATGKIHEMKLTPEEKFEDISIEMAEAEFLYQDGDMFTFMNPSTFEQFEIPGYMLGNFKDFIKEGVKVKCDFYSGQIVGVVIPETVELKVISTGSGIKGDADATYKNAILENNMEIMVPQFIKPGDIIKVSVSTRHYVERVQHKG